MEVLLINKIINSWELWYLERRGEEEWSLKKIDRGLTKSRQMDILVSRYLYGVLIGYENLGKGEEQ